MSERVTARHRAPRRASTPLTTTITGLGSAVAPRVEALGRGGAVIAVSSGLVASMGLPAQAAPFPAEAGTRTAGLPVLNTDGLSAVQVLTLATPVTGDPLVVDGSLSIDPAAQVGTSLPLSASATARLSFEVGTMTATAAPTRTTHSGPAAGQAPARTAAGRTAVAHGVSTHTSRGTGRTTSSSGASQSATASGSSSGTGSSAKAARVGGSSVLAVAARYVGISYRMGGTSPSGFDCSGYVQYVYRLLGVSLPRTTDQQLAVVTRVSRLQARPGDLVFFMSGRGAYHVGIYAGGGMMYDSPRTGKRISKRAIFSSNVVFGRV